MESDDIAFIRQEIRRQVQIILFGAAGDTSEVINEDIVELIPGMSTITSRPVMHPYGFASRATQGTISVVARCGDHAGNRTILGHRAKDRPTDLQEGETQVYSAGGYQFRVQNGAIVVMKDGGEKETFVVGDTLVSLLSSFLDAIIAHTHAAPGTPPTNIATFTSLKANFISNDKILAKDGGRY